MWTGPDGCLKALWFHYRRGTLSLGNLNLFEWAVSRPALYSGERHYLSRPLYQHPWKESPRKGQLVPCFQDIQKQERSVRNYLPRMAMEVENRFHSDNESPLALMVLLCTAPFPAPLAHTRDLQRKRRKQRQGNENYNSFFCNWWILVTCPSWCTQHSLLKLKMEKTILSNPNSIYPLDFYTELPLWTQIYSECSHNLEVSKLHVPPKCKIQRPMIKATT